MLRIVADEHIPKGVLQALQRRGVDIVTLRDVGRAGLPDLSQLQWAFVAQRVMLTQDDDYLALASSGLRHAGILYCHPLKYLRQPGRFASAVAELALLEPAVITGTARFV